MRDKWQWSPLSRLFEIYWEPPVFFYRYLLVQQITHGREVLPSVSRTKTDILFQECSLCPHPLIEINEWNMIRVEHVWWMNSSQIAHPYQRLCHLYYDNSRSFFHKAIMTDNNPIKTWPIKGSKIWDSGCTREDKKWPGFESKLVWWVWNIYESPKLCREAVKFIPMAIWFRLFITVSRLRRQNTFLHFVRNYLIITLIN